MKNRPLWPLLTAALIGLPVLYVASLLPIGWLGNRGMIPDGGLLMSVTRAYIWPVQWASENGPDWLIQGIRRLDDSTKP